MGFKKKGRYSRKSLEQDKIDSAKAVERLRMKMEANALKEDWRRYASSDEESAERAKAIEQIKPIPSYKKSTYKRRFRHN